MSNPTHTIIAGPDRFNLMMSLFSAAHPRPTVEFTVHEYSKENGHKWKENVHVNSVSLEDGSGHRFCFQGYNAANKCNLNGYYDVQVKLGWIKFHRRG